MVAQVREELGEPARGDDRCPYSRSFSPSFAENPRCPAFQATVFTVTNTAHEVLGSATTCRHLAIGNHARHSGRFYPRCGLGGPAQRLEWLAEVTPGRLAVMRSLEEEFAELTGTERTALIEAKARLLGGGHTDGAEVERLEVQLSAFLDRVDQLITERRERLVDVGLPAERLQELLHDWSLAWLRDRELFTPAITELPVRGLTRPAGAFLGAGGPAGAAMAAGELVATAGPLVIERTGDPMGLRLRGEIDVTNSEAIATAVSSALADAAEVAVDFHEVLFCDLSGLRALVRAAEEAGADQRIVVRGLPAHLRRALAIVGWADLPHLVVIDDPAKVT
jgi:anti-anti-sigma factor